MIEVQHHGFHFEKWVRDSFFGRYEGSYGQEWDVPAQENRGVLVPREFRRLNVSVKTCRFRSPIGLGDAMRQRNIRVDFLMIVGFWEQASAEEKRIVDIGVAKFAARQWQDLWTPLRLESLADIDGKIKNLELPYAEARRLAREWKRLPEARPSGIVINPKIDSKRQRRMQCSLPFAVFWERVGREPEAVAAPRLFGQPFLNPMRSSARRFRSA